MRILLTVRQLEEKVPKVHGRYEHDNPQEKAPQVVGPRILLHYPDDRWPHRTDEGHRLARFDGALRQKPWRTPTKDDATERDESKGTVPSVIDESGDDNERLDEAAQEGACTPGTNPRQTYLLRLIGNG